MESEGSYERATPALHRVARRIRLLRERLGMRQDEFALRCGISVSFASLIERGERSPSFETLVQIANTLKVPLAELFHEGEEVRRPPLPHLDQLLDFATRARLTKAEVERLIAVAEAMFGISMEEGETMVAPEVRCSVQGCDRATLAKGLCVAHYHRARRKP